MTEQGKTRTIRIIRAMGGERMLKAHAENGAAVQIRISLTLDEQKTLTPSLQDHTVRARIKEALLEIAGKV